MMQLFSVALAIFGTAVASSSEVTIPTAISRNEIMSRIYREYVTPGQSGVPALSDLRVGNDHGYRCEFYSIQNGNLTEQVLDFQSVSSGGGRFIRLRLQQDSLDRQTSYLLQEGPYGEPKGWRGQELRLSRQVDLTPMVGEDTVRSNRQEPDFHFRRLLTTLKSMSGRAFPTVCVRSNATNPRELFIELGSKTETLFVDGNGDEIHNPGSRGVTVEGIMGEVGQRYQYPVSLASIENKYPPILFGNDSKPVSFCFSDLEEQQQPKVAYRMEGIGICTLPE